jgi:hypothetical protein
VEKVRDEEGNVVGYKAHSKNYLDVNPAEAATQMDAIQGYHRRMRILQQTESVEEANKADVAANSKDPRTRV